MTDPRGAELKAGGLNYLVQAANAPDTLERFTRHALKSLAFPYFYGMYRTYESAVPSLAHSAASELCDGNPPPPRGFDGKPLHPKRTEESP